MPFVEREKYQLSQHCRLHPDNDIFRDQEQNKIHVDINEWRCGYCRKSFRSEKYLDQHLGNRHSNLLNTVCWSLKLTFRYLLKLKKSIIISVTVLHQKGFGLNESRLKPISLSTIAGLKHLYICSLCRTRSCDMLSLISYSTFYEFRVTASAWQICVELCIVTLWWTQSLERANAILQLLQGTSTCVRFPSSTRPLI